MSHFAPNKVGKLKPIGFVRSPFQKREDVIGSEIAENVGEIEIYKEYEEGLGDLDGFSHIIVIFWMHKSSFKSTLVRPIYHPERLRGIFATRHPDRPNPLGMTVVELAGRNRNVLKVRGIDMIDGTPVLDIKPYTERDRKERARFGWLGDVRGMPEEVSPSRRRRKTRKNQTGEEAN